MAINLLKDAVAVNPKASESWLLLAKFHYERQDFLSAIQALEKCLSLDPNNLAAQAAYADSLAKAHRIDEAGELFTKLLADKKTSTPFVLTSYADFLYTQERYSDALEYVTESDAQHPNCGRTLYTTARILLKLNRVPEATQEAERAVKMDSGFRLARILLVRLYELQGETQEATEQKAWLRTDSDKNH